MHIDRCLADSRSLMHVGCMRREAQRPSEIVNSLAAAVDMQASCITKELPASSQEMCISGRDELSLGGQPRGIPRYSRDVTIKVPPKGSRGVPFPHFLMAFGNRWVLRQFKRHEMRTAGGIAALLLETVGAKSGQPRKAVLGYLDEGGGSWLVIASTAGASYHPAWLYNLAKQPDATIEFDDGRRIPVRAETLEGQELEAAWARIAKDAPEYAAYRSKTDRDIPVLRLRQR